MHIIMTWCGAAKRIITFYKMLCCCACMQAAMLMVCENLNIPRDMILKLGLVVILSCAGKDTTSPDDGFPATTLT